jgi:two-component system sensor histidine kinase PhoQ
LKAGIQTRLLLITTVVLGTFLSLAGVVLDRSFRASVLDGAEDQLRLVIYSLMGSLEKDRSGLRFGDELPEPRLHQPESGLYAEVTEREDEPGWQSPSAVTTAVRFPTVEALAAGEFRFEEFVAESDPARFLLRYAVIWEDESVLTFSVATDRLPFQSTIAEFRRNLYIGLGAVTVFFVLAQVLAVRWGLRPLRTMTEEVRELEEGQRERLSSAYPIELEGLAENLDRFITHEERNRTRYKKAMEDLAHSLKTPLAVMRNDIGARDQAGNELMREQLDRMETTVTHQLNRASVSGPVIVGRAVPIGSLIDRLLRALHSAYSDRGIEVKQSVPDTLRVRGDERDLLEMLGNLLENAFKYTHRRIEISGTVGTAITILVEDDGPGIEGPLRDQVLNRGTRADEIQPGQGIGLAMVHELVAAYEGSLAIGESRWGGASIALTLPV